MNNFFFCLQGERLPKPEACSDDIYQLMMSCWAREHRERPTFVAVNDFLTHARPDVLKVMQPQNEPGRMQIEVDDFIEVIDGKTDNYWYQIICLNMFCLYFYLNCNRYFAKRDYEVVLLFLPLMF